MPRFGKIAALTLTCGAIYTTAAYAQATRTFVSGVGNDADPCSRTAPCKTFAGAFTKTATGGEINCLDPAGYGGLTISKSLSIVCDYTGGGVLTTGAGVSAFIINLPSSNDRVYLSGLDFHGGGTAQNGIRIVSGGFVHVNNSSIRSFQATNGLGIQAAPANILKLTVSNSIIENNGAGFLGGIGGGIGIEPTGAGGTANVNLENVQIVGNAGNALRASTTLMTSTTPISLSAANSVFTGSQTGITLATNSGGTGISAFVSNSRITYHGGIGVTANNNATVRFMNSLITGNTTGVSATSGGQIQSYGNNQLISNPSAGAANNGAFTATIPED